MRPSHHDFRHLFITYLMEQGVPPHNIAKWVGHLDHGRLIMATYTSIRDQVETDLIDRLEKNLTRSELPKNVVPQDQAL